MNRIEFIVALSDNTWYIVAIDEEQEPELADDNFFGGPDEDLIQWFFERRQKDIEGQAIAYIGVLSRLQE